MHPLATAALAALLCPLASHPAAAQEAAPPASPPEDRTYTDGEAGESILEIVRAARREHNFTGAVLAARDGQVVAAIGIGTTTTDHTAEPITPATLFEIASATKQFTAAAILHLQQNGELTLDDPIAEHLPGIPDDCRAITIRHLLAHTSGIPGTNSQGGGDDLAAVLPSFLAGGPRHEPGTHFEYWNQGYALLSEVVARASGMPYTDYCRENLFEPAGMSQTRFTGDDPPEGGTVAIGRSARGEPRSALEHPYGAYGFQYRGMGGVVTNVRDLWLWHRALEDGKILTPESLEAFFRPGLGNYALGWRIHTNERGLAVQSHGGAVRGFTCDIRRYPEHDACVFVLANRDDFPPYRLAQRIEDALFADLAPDDALPAELRGRLTGTYEADGRPAVLTIRDDGGVTRSEILWYPGGPTSRSAIRLDDSGTPVLSDGGGAYPIEIIEEEDGRATTITITIGDPPLTFRRAD